MLGEYDGSGKLIANYTYGIDLASRVDGSGAADYYDFDATGNTAGLSGQTGAYVDSYSYLPFGEETGSSGSVPNPFQYVGQDGVMTAGNGLDFMRARFYSPSTGRFIQRDPTGLAGGANLYAYTANDPVNLVDPTGLVGYGFGYNFNGNNYVNASRGGTYEVNPETLTSRAVSTNPGSAQSAAETRRGRALEGLGEWATDVAGEGGGRSSAR